MVAKHWRMFLADFDARYERWITAQEYGDLAEMKAAEKALAALNDRARTELAELDSKELDPLIHAVRKRAIVLGYERAAYERKRRRKQKATQQRREARTIRMSRKVALPTACARCGAKFENLKTTGRPRVYCSPACRKAAHEARRSGNDDAVRVQVVERVVTEVRERRTDVTHPRRDCVDAVFADDKALVDVIWTLIDRVRDPEDPVFTPDNYRFWDLYNTAEVLYETLVKRAARDKHCPSTPTPTPMSKHERNMQRMTRPHPSTGSVDR